MLNVTDDTGKYIGNINPFRYRSYYYDLESELYYLNSRYYDPETGRFINADGYISTGQYLHGVNNDFGGFHISCTIVRLDGVTAYNLTYTWNDLIDPNFNYESDSIKAEFAKSIPFADPTDYYIQISWSDASYIYDKDFRKGYGWLS